MQTWLSSPRFDLCFLILPGLVVSLLYIPGPHHDLHFVGTLYILLLVFFNHPHHFLTYLGLSPHRPDSKIRYWPILLSLLLVVTVSSIALVPALSSSVPFIFIILLNWNIWHIVKQHQGIMKIYDEVQAPGTSQTGRPFGILLFLVLNLGLVWSYSQNNLSFELVRGKPFTLNNGWRLPTIFFEIYLTATLVFATVLVYKRIRETSRRPLRAPQLLLFLSAAVTHNIPFFFLTGAGLSYFFICTNLFHTIQYFAFYWLYRSRSTHPEERILQRMRAIFVWPLVYSAVLIFVFKWLVSPALLTMLFLAVTAGHNAIEHYLWRRSHNRHLPDFLRALSQ